MTAKDPVDVDRHVGSLIKARRLKVGMSQSEVATALGITFQQVQKYEKGYNRLTAGRLFQLAEILNVNAAYFFPLTTLGSIPDEDSFVLDLIQSKEAIELVRNYASIIDPQVRRSIGGLVASFARCATKGNQR